MSSDATGREPTQAPPDIWTLPAITDVRAVLVKFAKPLIRYVGTKRVEYPSAVELMVKTAGSIPERAISPVLVVGEIAVDDYEAAGEKLYRFYAFEPEKLREGASMRLMWPVQHARIERKGPEFRLDGEEQR